MTYQKQKLKLFKLKQQKSAAKFDIARCILVAAPSGTIAVLATIAKNDAIFADNISRAIHAGNVQLLFTLIGCVAICWLIGTMSDIYKINKQIQKTQKQLRKYQQQNAQKSR